MDTYNKRDINIILKRAFELQQRISEREFTSTSDEELTLEEIEEIAREVGVSPDFVREAVLEYAGIPVEEPLFIDTGEKDDIELLGFAKGELDQKTWAELRAMIEYHFDCPGKVKRRPHGIIWEAKPKGILKFLHTRKSPSVEVNTSANKSDIRIRKSLKTYNVLLYPSYAALAGAAMLLTALADSSDAIPIFLVITALLGAAKLFHHWFKNKKEKARRQLKDMMEQLQTIITRRSKAQLSRPGEKEVIESKIHFPAEEYQDATVPGGKKRKDRN